VLRIVQGQRVSLHKQTPKLTEQMIRECRTLVGETHPSFLAN
jgi:hypothetical protein